MIVQARGVLGRGVQHDQALHDLAVEPLRDLDVDDLRALRLPHAPTLRLREPPHRLGQLFGELCRSEGLLRLDARAAVAVLVPGPWPDRDLELDEPAASELVELVERASGHDAGRARALVDVVTPLASRRMTSARA